VVLGMLVGLWPAGSAHASTQLAQRESGGAGGITMPGKRAAAQSSNAQSETIAWSLIWRDEFSGTGGVDATQWLYDVGTRYPGGPANWGTGEIDTLTDSTDNVFQNSGFLNIRAIHTSTNPLVGWTSGRIETQHIGFQPPADGALAVEASIQLPNLTGSAAQGYWPAFWMLGSPYRGNYYNWPEVGEIDIMESVNGQNQWWGTFHCGYEPGGPCNETTGLTGTALGFSPSLQAAFHTYRMEFDKSVSPQEIRWYVDGVQYHVVTADDVDAQTWADATDHGFFILLNVAIGGIWPGPPGTLTASGGTMRVDYVRVYQWPVHATYLPMLRE
jgi:beta-glucanase (GH16 family)